MTKFAAACAVLAGACVLAFAPAGRAADAAEAEARAAFAKVLDSAKKQDRAQFRAQLTKASQQEMDAAAKKGAKPYETLMGVLAGHDPVKFTVEMKDATATFVGRGKLKLPTGEIDQVTVFKMVREGGQWKFSLD